MLQRLALYFETSARKKIQSRSTVVKLSRSRSLFEALKTLRFKKYVSKSKKFRERLKSINFHHKMAIIRCSFIDTFKTKGCVYTFAALDSLIKPLFHSFEFACESSAIKSHLLLTASKRALSKAMSEGINRAFRVHNPAVMPISEIRREVVMSWQSVASLDSWLDLRFSIPARMENQESKTSYRE